MTNSKETPEVLELARARYRVARGRLIWKVDFNRAKRNDFAGCADSKGYCVVRIAGALFKAHRVIFALHYGRWPVGDLDHKNGVRNDNRIRNLREASPAQNMWNRRPHVNSTSGCLGVYFTGRKWRAQMRFCRRAVLHRDFDTFENAVAARRAAERKYFGRFAPHRGG